MRRARAQLAPFVADVFASVSRKDRRAKGGCHLRGLMLDGFVNRSTWDPVPVRRRIAQRMVPQAGPDVWAVDDAATSFPAPISHPVPSPALAPPVASAARPAGLPGTGKTARTRAAMCGRSSVEAWSVAASTPAGARPI